MADLDSIALTLGRVPSGLYVVTVGDAGGGTAFLGSFVQQISLSPPLLTAAVGPGRYAHELMTKADYFGVHIIEKDQKQFLRHFGRGFGKDEDAFAGWKVDRSRFGVPLIQELPLRLVLRKTKVLETGGDHALFVGEVVSADFPEGTPTPEPWVHLRKNGLSY